jgi:DNA invertase Pin-like site-specific DNA recombinase
MSDKIRAQHLTRKAMLYVRQSSAYQVSHNLESQKLQYAMQDRLHQLGWNEIEVIDEDLGRSAAGTQTRTGFERMVAEVCLGHVGAVAAVRFRDLRATVASGNSWLRCAASSTRCSLIRRACTRHGRATIVCCSA